MVRQIEPRAKFPAHVHPPGPDVWRIVIPQIACHSVALRNAMFACGTLLLSVHNKELGESYKKSVSEVMRFSTRAVHDLANNVKPLIETVLTAYTFWSLDLAACNLQSALMHLDSALKISQQCRKELASDALASTFVHCMLSFFGDNPGDVSMPELDPDPPELRKRKAVVRLEAEYERVTAYAPRIAALKDLSQKHGLLNLVEEARREIQWLLSKYSHPMIYAKWLAHRPGQIDEDPTIDPTLLTVGIPTIFPQFLSRLETYLTAVEADEFLCSAPLEMWRKDAALEMLLFPVLTAQTDLPLRHISMDFLEISREIRWPLEDQI
jgi:hypothetical protein